MPTIEVMQVQSFFEVKWFVCRGGCFFLGPCYGKADGFVGETVSLKV